MEKKGKVKIRKSVRTFYILALVLIILLSWYSLYRTSRIENNATKKDIYEYTNKYFYSFDVDLIDNKFITSENVSDPNTYITDLINTVPTNMTYTYTSNNESDITYSYQIVGNLEAVYKKDGEEQKVWKMSDVIVPMKEMEIHSDKVEINENFTLNLKDKIDMITSFEVNLGMQVTTNYTVLLEVVTKTNFEGEEIINSYSPNLVFEIGPKTTVVHSDTQNSEKPTVISKIEVEKANPVSNIQKAIVSFVDAASAILLLLIFIKTRNSNSVKNEYKQALNKILKGFEEKIVEVNQRIETEGQNVVDIKEFDEIIKVSEELFKPILYWNNDKEEESWFCVLGNNIIYRFILKR